MHSTLITQDIARQRAADLQRSAQHRRLARAASRRRRPRSLLDLRALISMRPIRRPASAG